jgi:hypothetical protein
MKPAILLATAAMAIATATTAMPANAADPCGAVLCMSHETPPHECKDYVDGYFDIRVYRRKHGRKRFDPEATSKERYREIF